MKRKDIVNSTDKNVVAIRNKIPVMFISLLEEIIKNNDIQNLDPKDRVDFLMKLLAYIIPKPTEKKDEEEESKTRQNITQFLIGVGGIESFEVTAKKKRTKKN